VGVDETRRFFDRVGIIGANQRLIGEIRPSCPILYARYSVIHARPHRVRKHQAPWWNLIAPWWNFDPVTDISRRLPGTGLRSRSTVKGRRPAIFFLERAIDLGFDYLDRAARLAAITPVLVLPSNLNSHRQPPASVQLDDGVFHSLVFHTKSFA